MLRIIERASGPQACPPSAHAGRLPAVPPPVALGGRLQRCRSQPTRRRQVVLSACLLFMHVCTLELRHHGFRRQLQV